MFLFAQHFVGFINRFGVYVVIHFLESKYKILNRRRTIDNRGRCKNILFLILYYFFHF